MVTNSDKFSRATFTTPTTGVSAGFIVPSLVFLFHTATATPAMTTSVITTGTVRLRRFGESLAALGLWFESFMDGRSKFSVSIFVFCLAIGGVSERKLHGETA